MGDYSLNACLESVTFEVEQLHANPFEMLGRYIIRARQDMFFNKTMIAAVEKYIDEHQMKWDER